MPRYYARHCDHGLNHVWDNGDGTVDRLPGTILRFDTRGARDAYVEADTWDGNYHREALTRDQIEPIIRKAKRHAAHPRATIWEREDGAKFDHLLR